MTLFRRLLLLAATSVGAAVLAGPVFAARPGALPNLVTTTHFVVHFQSDPTLLGAATQAEAGWIAASAESAYNAETADGYVAPLADGGLGGDSRIDIYVADLTPFGNPLGVSIPDSGGSPSSGYIELDGTQPENAFTPHTIAHELFHLVQFGIWVSASYTDNWLYESTAEWMGYRATGYDVSGGLELGPPYLSLDCSDPNGLAECDLSDPYANGGYSRWGFFEYINERFGASFVKDVFTQAASADDALAGLNAALAAKGTNLADTFDAWSTVDMSGGYTRTELQTYRPHPVGSVSTGVETGQIFSATVTVNHLAAEYIAITKGDGDDSHPCFAASLTFNVTMPAGTQSKPAFFWDVKGSTPVQLSVNGNTATTTLPWDTCNWSGFKGYLSLPNASQTVDGADFHVSASMTVDTSKPTTATPPPDLVTLPGVVTAPSAAIAPDIDVFGPELLTLSAAAQQVRLIVSSSGEGTLKAQLGSVSLGTQTLRAGNNDLRFTIPKDMLKTLRRSASAANLLTLTPASANGATVGTSVTRRVVVTPAKTLAKTPAKKTKRHKK
ncbi:MAG: hypothetical protein QOF28_611 [Actinomycetota bacterium]|nr:hypothetical protein [Actinomycetota bacterium]